MTAVLRENFEIANLLIKNNLATKGYVNREGRDVRQIAEDGNRVRALAYLDNREIPRQQFLKRDGSVDHVPMAQSSTDTPMKNIKKSGFANRKQSIEPPTLKRDDIFGNSYTGLNAEAERTRGNIGQVAQEETKNAPD